ncbi:hypothetical protein [Natranaerobius trueperi]|uniref:YkvI family membrane protein n=1 Tax=Natranaerobius trueperi TaxID=759412 RepID=UPI00197C9B72|nr:hypothetical protein [Natranaerobius trueperi]
MDVKKILGPSAAIAFVWFTTHFGGGFAAGRQLIDYYVNFGRYAAFLPFFSMLIVGIAFYYGWLYAIAHKTFDYASFGEKFYGNRAIAIVFEIAYIILLVVATAVAFATGGEVIKDAIGTPYIINTIVIAVVIFFLTIYGARVVRNAATSIAIIVIVGLVLIFGSNIIINFEGVSGVISAGETNTGFGPALWQMLLYVGFQSFLFCACVAVAEPLKTKADAKKAATIGTLVNGLLVLLASIGILGYYPDILAEEVPTLYVAERGFGGLFATYATSLLILLGVISTGVNLVFGGVKRIVSNFSKGNEANDRRTNIIASVLYVLLTWAIALLGLIWLIQIGYGYLGYVGLFLIVIPFIVKGVLKSKEWPIGDGYSNDDNSAGTEEEST